MKFAPLKGCSSPSSPSVSFSYKPSGAAKPVAAAVHSFGCAASSLKRK